MLRKQIKMKLLETQIRELKNIIEPHKESEELLRLSTELKNRLIKWDSEIQNKKNKTFVRDLDDFRKGNIFKWQMGPVDVAFTQTQPSPPNLETINTALPIPRENTVYTYDYSEYDDIGTS